MINSIVFSPPFAIQNKSSLKRLVFKQTHPRAKQFKLGYLDDSFTVVGQKQDGSWIVKRTHSFQYSSDNSNLGNLHYGEQMKKEYPKYEVDPSRIIRFNPQGFNAQRKGYYVPDTVTHPAKMPTYLAQWLIEKYTEPGETVLDCMAGCGTTVIEAMKLGRNAIGIEYEQKFVDIVHKNIELTKKHERLISYGDGKILQGDARELSNVLKEKLNEDVDVVPWINNEERKTYLNQMQLVYNQCFAVLKPGGLMVLVTKNFVKTGQQVRLDLDTIKLCENAGFKFHERWYRQISMFSFWIDNARKKWYKKHNLEGREKEKLDVYPYFEDILCFIKPQRNGENK